MQSSVPNNNLTVVGTVPGSVDNAGVWTPNPGGGGGGGGPASIADGADVAQGATTDAAATTDAGSFSLIALVKRLLGKLTAGISVFTPTPASFFAGQLKITTTGTAVQLPSNALLNGVKLWAATTNTAKVFYGPAGVNNSDAGAGNGVGLVAGQASAEAVSNSNLLYINGTAGDYVYYSGN